MATKPVGNFKQVMGVPNDGTPWTWHKKSLKESPAWRARSIHCVRLLEFLEIEHLSHAAHENGHLKATYGQLVASGITRRYISIAIAEAEALGLLHVQRGGKCALAKDHMNVYRLTYYGAKTTETRFEYYTEATNEWAKVTDADVKRIKREMASQKAKSNRKRPSPFSKIIFSGANMGNRDGANVWNLPRCQRVEPSHGKVRLSTVPHA